MLFALIFLMSGPMHFSGQTIAYAASQGVPLPSILVPFSGLLALVGGLSILLGYRAKIGAWLIAVFLVGVTATAQFLGGDGPDDAPDAVHPVHEERRNARRSAVDFAVGEWILES